MKGNRSRGSRRISHQASSTRSNQAAPLSNGSPEMRGPTTGVHLWNCAVGASAGKQVLFENTNTDMSSFFPLSTTGWGQVESEIVSQDDYD
jgi:hypothetical protein